MGWVLEQTSAHSLAHSGDSGIHAGEDLADTLDAGTCRLQSHRGLSRQVVHRHTWHRDSPDSPDTAGILDAAYNVITRESREDRQTDRQTDRHTNNG